MLESVDIHITVKQSLVRLRVVGKLRILQFHACIFFVKNLLNLVPTRFFCITQAHYPNLDGYWAVC